MDDRTRHVTAAVSLVLATPVAVWWVVGDVSSKGFDDLDYMVRPVELPSVVEAVIGGLAVVLVIVCGAVLGHALYRGRVRRAWSATVVPLFAAGVVVGAGWRVVTAGGIGANIGGGLVVLFGGPLVVALIVVAVANAWVESRR